MAANRLDGDARIKLSIKHGYGFFIWPRGLAFDHRRGLLLVTGTDHRVQVFSCDDGDGGSLVSKFGEEGDQPGQLM